MISGLVLGLMMYASLVLTHMKLPSFVKKQISNWKLLTDISVGITVYVLLGAISKSIVAIVAAVVTSIMIGLTLELGPWLEHERTKKSP